MNLNNNGPGATVIKAQHRVQGAELFRQQPAADQRRRANTAGSKTGQCIGL